MDAIRFVISGLSAFFKSPDLNTADKDVYYSFPHIHKVAIAGIIGAIAGWDGRQKDMFQPEFWEKFKDFQVAIVPAKPVFKTTKMYCTNTVGYANLNRHTGPTTMEFAEHWLVGRTSEPLKWIVYIADNGSDMFKDISDRILSNRFVYAPYLGNNTHFADINGAEMVFLEKTDSDRVHSIITKNVELQERTARGKEKRQYCQFSAPVGLDNGYYVYTQNIITNLKVIGETIYTDGQNNIMFQ